MMLRSVLAVCSLCVSVAAPTHAAGLFYDCTMDVDEPNGWVSPKVGLVFDAAGKLQVIDAPVLHFVGKPVPAKVRRRGASMRFNWSIREMQDSTGRRIPDFRYDGKLDTATGAISVFARP
ncbi:hypothetical protein [Sulfitobacter sp. S190]|uniref:hypothetical protein n=1 Tax=Sulfitobacter sp. S190 TaxID=2867022 RepID=UPI0021A5575C|nr:hypothetical protein [Sulfitobacter sp. S190]UWR21344.1 hypothetical protein K3756_11550 [Sulfitobacter sp. S190]